MEKEKEKGSNALNHRLLQEEEQEEEHTCLFKKKDFI